MAGTSKTVPVLLIVLALLAFVADVTYHYPKLPARMASHFDARGQPDGWMGKQQFVGLATGVLLLVLVVLVPIGYAISILPRALINLPNKDYWLAPEQEQETRRYLGNWALWFAVATIWFVTFVFHGALAANLRQPPHMPWMWSLFTGYLAVVAWLVIRLLLRFRCEEEKEP